MGLQERLLKKVDKISKSPCWQCVGFINQNGYAIITRNYRPKRAHRVSYELFVGPIPEGLELDHLCRNRSCVNPKHLEPVTRKENLRRSPLACWSGGLALRIKKKVKTHCVHGHPYSGDNLIVRGNGWRVCRECKLIYMRKRYVRRYGGKPWLGAK
jgi:hypothetical protein